MQHFTPLLLALLGLLVLGLALRSKAMSRELSALTKKLAHLEARTCPRDADADQSDPSSTLGPQRRTSQDYYDELKAH